MEPDHLVVGARAEIGHRFETPVKCRNSHSRNLCQPIDAHLFPEVGLDPVDGTLNLRCLAAHLQRIAQKVALRALAHAIDQFTCVERCKMSYISRSLQQHDQSRQNIDDFP